MAHQVIRQPGEPELYSIFSSFSDSWIGWNFTRNDVIDWFARRAEKEARESIQENPKRAYYQFTMTYEEANQRSIEHGGKNLVADPKEGGVSIAT